MLGARVVLFLLFCLLLVLVLILSAIWLYAIRAAAKTESIASTERQRMAEEPEEFVEGEFHRIDTS